MKLSCISKYISHVIAEERKQWNRNSAAFYTALIAIFAFATRSLFSSRSYRSLDYRVIILGGGLLAARFYVILKKAGLEATIEKENQDPAPSYLPSDTTQALEPSTEASSSAGSSPEEENQNPAPSYLPSDTTQDLEPSTEASSSAGSSPGVSETQPNSTGTTFSCLEPKACSSQALPPLSSLDYHPANSLDQRIETKASLDLFHLPPELIMLISTFLDFKDIARFEQTCKGAQAIADLLFQDWILSKGCSTFKNIVSKYKKMSWGEIYINKINQPHEDILRSMTVRVFFNSKLLSVDCPKTATVFDVKRCIAKKLNRPVSHLLFFFKSGGQIDQQDDGQSWNDYDKSSSIYVEISPLIKNKELAKQGITAASSEGASVNEMFPEEILLNIFQFLTAQDLGRLSQVCSTWNRLGCK